MKKNILFGLLAAFLALPAVAQNFNVVTPSGHTVRCKIMSNGYADISRGNVADTWANQDTVTYKGHLIIPSTVEYEGTTYTVTRMGYDNDFKNCTGITELTIPSTVTTFCSFSNCTSLATVHWNAAGIASYGVFEKCTSLTVVNLGSEVPQSNYFSYFFSAISNLQSINVDADNEDLQSIDGVLYDKDGYTLIFCPMGHVGNVTIGENVEILKEESMLGCTIDTLFLNASDCVPESDYYGDPSTAFDSTTHIGVLMIGDEVYNMPTGLVDLPSLTDIHVASGNFNHFSHDGMLTDEDNTVILRYPAGRTGTFTIPDGMTTVADGAFKDCRGLTAIDLNDLRHVGEKSFMNCTGIAGIDLSGLTCIGKSAFEGCTGLRRLTIPQSLDTLSTRAFYGNHLDTLFYNAKAAMSPYYDSYHKKWTLQRPDNVFTSDSLRVVVMGDGVRYIGGLFTGCKRLDEVALPASLRRIDRDAFKGAGLTAITLPDSLDSIGTNAFSATKLVEATIPASVSFIGGEYSGNYHYIFYDCDKLKTVYFNPTATATLIEGGYVKLNAVNLIGGTTKLKKLVICEGVRNISPFVYSGSIDTLVLPQSLDSIIHPHNGYNYSGLSDCQLKYLVFNCKHAEYFKPDNKSTTIHDPNGAVFGECTSLKHVVFGDSVEFIPTACFKGCTQVQEFANTLTLPAGLKGIGSRAFEGCTQIRAVTIPATVTAMGVNPFLKCSKLKKFVYNATHADFTDDHVLPAMSREYKANSALSYDNVAKGSNPLANTVGLREFIPPVDTLVIGPGVEQITPCLLGFPWNQMLDSSAYTQHIYIDNQSSSLRSIAMGAFANLNILNAQSLFTDSIEYIGNGAFMNCTGISKAMLPEGCWYVGNAAFRNVQELDSVSLPSTLLYIGTDAFANDSSISYLYYDCDSASIPASEVSFSATPFNHTVSLRTIDFGSHVRYLAEGMFKNAEGLERVELPEGLLWIDPECFYMKMKKPAAGGSDALATTTTPQAAPAEQQKIVIISGSTLTDEVDTTRLRYVSLPSTCSWIGGRAFSSNGYHVIDTVICRGTEPSTLLNDYYTASVNYLGGITWSECYDWAFDDTTKAAATLFVPCGSKSEYEDYADDYYTERWGDFQHIEEQTPYSVELTVNVDTMGTAEWECAEGGVLLTATPAASHRFVQWSDGETSNPRTIVLVSDTSLEAQFAWGVYYTLTVASENAARGSATGGGTYIQDTVVTLTATPLYGYHFTQWSDGDTTNPRQYTVTANATLNASFAPNQYTLTVLCDSDQGTVSGGGSYDYKTSHSIEATPLTGYHFNQWSDGETANPRNVTLTQDTLFTAEFSINVYTLTVTAGEHGTVSEGGDYEHGTEVTLTATPDEGYHFSQWSDGETANPRTVVMTADITLAAGFAPNRYSVTATVGCGEATVNTVEATADSADYGTTVVLTATAGEGYYFMNWTDGTVENPRTVTVTQDTVLSACFAVYTYTVTVGCNEERGSVTAEGATGEGGAYRYGDTATLMATANEHWHFVKWSDGSTDNPMKVVVKSNLEYTAIFAIDQHVVTVNSADATQGTVMGGGKVDYGGEATLTAQAKTGYHFSHWQDGNADNPRVVTVTGDTTFTAYFEANEPDGITDVYEAAGVNVKVVDGCIIVEGAEGRQVRLYDVVGRRIADSHRHLSSGIYLLQVDGLPARRVVVM